nr:MAG TPA: type I neck protein [Caudoviricetes sp.]
MARLEVNGLAELELSFEEMARLPDDVTDKMLLAGAGVAEKAQRAKGIAYGVYRTGLTLASITHDKIRKNKDGKSVNVVFKGTNKNGNRNAEIAYINEFGKTRQAARPFIRDANEECADAVVTAEEQPYNEWLDSL